MLEGIQQLADPKIPMVVDGLLLNYPVAVAAWLSPRVMQGELMELPGYGIGILPADESNRIIKPGEVVDLAAAAMFYDYHGGRGGWSDISVCAAADNMRPVTPQIIRAVLAYPFGFLKVRHITATVDHRNKDMLALMERFGFRQTGAKPGVCDDGGDVLMFSLKPEWSPHWSNPIAAIANAA
jgi:hypothetical protein